MKRILLLRHGLKKEEEFEANIGLSEEGKELAATVGKGLLDKFGKPEKILFASSKRTEETATIIAKAAGRVKVLENKGIGIPAYEMKEIERIASDPDFKYGDVAAEFKVCKRINSSFPEREGKRLEETMKRIGKGMKNKGFIIGIGHETIITLLPKRKLKKLIEGRFILEPLYGLLISLSENNRIIKISIFRHY